MGGRARAEKGRRTTCGQGSRRCGCTGDVEVAPGRMVDSCAVANLLRPRLLWDPRQPRARSNCEVVPGETRFVYVACESWRRRRGLAWRCDGRLGKQTCAVVNRRVPGESGREKRNVLRVEGWAGVEWGNVVSSASAKLRRAAPHLQRCE